MASLKASPADSIGTFFWNQFFTSIPTPTTSFAGKTVIVTGSNTGLGKESARHFARLGASKVILAVRSLSKGEAAKHEIEASTGCAKDVVEVWELDMCDYKSVQRFAERADKELERLDAAVLNAGVAKMKYEQAAQDESTITVNVISTFLLSYLLLPTLKRTASKFNIRPNLVIVASEVHGWAKFAEAKAPQGKIFETLSPKTEADREKVDMNDRYMVSKLLEVYMVRAMCEKKPADQMPVTINYVNPGLCHSEIGRDQNLFFYIFKLIVARSSETGGRNLVHAATLGAESYGQYLSDCQICEPSKRVRTEEGQEMQKRIYDELVGRLEAIKPGVTELL